MCSCAPGRWSENELLALKISNKKTHGYMKKIAYALTLFVFTFFTCEKEESEYDRLRSNIVGEWIINSTGQEIRADTVYREFGGFTEATFNADGTGARKLKNVVLDTTIQFNWYYQYSPQQVIIIPKAAESNTPPSFSSPINLGLPEVHDVYKNEPDRQIWGHEEEVEDINNVLYIFRWTWKMERK